MIASLVTIARTAVLALCIVAVGSLARAQQQPSANAIALAKEIITLKGAGELYDPLVGDIVDRAKQTFIKINPMLSKDINDVANKLRAEMSGRSAELFNESARLYAGKFSEQELKDILAFYKSPLGKKVTSEEPAILDASVTIVDAWQRKLGDEMMVKFRAEMKKKGHDL
jgi:uncharacterized protein